MGRLLISLAWKCGFKRRDVDLAHLHHRRLYTPGACAIWRAK
jgi:hypothetical protein